jgi:hypothetical protein
MLVLISRDMRLRIQVLGVHHGSVAHALLRCLGQVNGLAGIGHPHQGMTGMSCSVHTSWCCASVSAMARRTLSSTSTPISRRMTARRLADKGLVDDAVLARAMVLGQDDLHQSAQLPGPNLHRSAL